MNSKNYHLLIPLVPRYLPWSVRATLDDRPRLVYVHTPLSVEVMKVLRLERPMIRRSSSR